MRVSKHVLGMLIMLVLASLACMQASAGALNEGQGTRDNPIAPRKFARTGDYEIRALSTIRPVTADNYTAPEGFEFMKVQFEVKCTKSEAEICDLTDLQNNIKVVSNTGILYTADPETQLDKPLAGEILGGAADAGWLTYVVPVGMTIDQALAQYGMDGANLIFFKLP